MSSGDNKDAAQQLTPRGKVVPPGVSGSMLSATDKAINVSKSLFAGAVAGAVSRTATSPLERLKVLRQVQTQEQKYKGLFRALRVMYKEEGLASYWKGNGTNVARIAPYSAIQFFAFDLYKKALLPNDERVPYKILLSGGLAGMTSSICCYPLDLVRSCLTVQTTNPKYKGMLHGLKVIYQEAGFFGLYKGLPPTLMGIAPYVAINFTTFDLLKRKFSPAPNSPYFDFVNLLLGACAGFTAAGLTYPTDVLRRRMQLQGLGIHGVNLPRYSSSWNCITTVIRTEGVAGMYKGMVPSLLKVVPSMAIAFTIHERLRRVLKWDPSIRSSAPSG